MWRLTSFLNLSDVKIEEKDKIKIVGIVSEILADKTAMVGAEYKEIYETPLLMSVEEAAKYLGVGRAKIKELAVNDRTFPIKYNGTKMMIKKRELPSWLKNHKKKTL